MLTQTQLEQLQNDQLVKDLESKGYNFDIHTKNQFRYWRQLFIQTHNEVEELEKEKTQLTLDVFKLTIEKNEAENGRLSLLAKRNVEREN